MATSCERGRCSAYSEDLRWRIVWQRDALQLSIDSIASNLCIHKSTVSRILTLFHGTGTVSKKPYPTEKAHRKLTPPVQLLILHLVIKRPGIYLREIQEELVNTLHVDVDVSTISRCLHSSGFTRQKLKITASQQDEFLRQQFISDVSVYDQEMLIFVDETGSDRRNQIRKYGYSIRGRPLKSYHLLSRGERVSAIACMSVNGLLDVETIKHTGDGDAFYDFVQCHLIPHLMPFNGINPHSIVILDNCAIHHVTEVVQSITDVGALVHFLPPYSPDFNPIEETFSKVKSVLQHNNATYYRH